MPQKIITRLLWVMYTPFERISIFFFVRARAKQRHGETERLHEELAKLLKGAGNSVRIRDIKNRLHELTGEYIP